MPKMAQIADNWETGCVMAQMRIKDIAAEAGVSPATVSRYLNNRPGQMTEETRARIAAVIERTGYRPRARRAQSAQLAYEPHRCDSG